jgi:hypothetical protein
MPELPTRARAAGPARLRRAHAWLRAAFVLHCTLIVYVGCAAGGGSISPIALAVVATALTVAPLVILLWRERRSSTAARPSHWVTRGLATVPVHAGGVGIASVGVFTPTGMTTWSAFLLTTAAVSVVELVPVVLANRALRRPLSADLGEIDIEIFVKIRSSVPWLPSWLSHDDVRLTDEALIITVRPGPTWGYARCIGLDEIREVEIRRTVDQDGAWFSVADGPVLWPPAGDVVVIHHRLGVQILPVDEPAGFAEVLEARVARAAG